jgi:hypothetical protein
MGFLKEFKNICAPALFYFIISAVVIITSILQNIGNTNKLSLGNYSFNVGNAGILLALKIVYVLFWTWVLSLICRAGYSSLSWVLVFLPFVIMFLIIVLLLLNQGIRSL